jgi:hypothetical protein
MSDVAVAEPAVPVTLFDDQRQRETNLLVTPDLAALFTYAHEWTQQGTRGDSATLSFSSMLAAMVAGEDPLCAWLRHHLSLRGVSEGSVTRGRRVGRAVARPPRLITTYSFRAGLREAQSLADAPTLDVRHFMAAYVVVPAYHREDFVRLKIDRRAWCLELADLLKVRFPAEADQWAHYALRAPAVLLPGFDADLPRGTDLLSVGREVEAFAMLIAGRDTLTPLSVGVFGAWGAGKSYFMVRLEERVAALTAAAGLRGAYLRRIAQVRFNAWHYSEGNIIASLVDQIVRNLRFAPSDTDAELADRRQQVVAEMASAEARRGQLQRELDEATTAEGQLRADAERVGREADEAIRGKQNELESAARAIAAAQSSLQQLLDEQATAIDPARRNAPVGEAALLFARTMLEDPDLKRLEGEVRRASDEARWLGLNQQNVIWGIVVLAVTIAAAFSVSMLEETKAFTLLVGLVAAAAPVASRLIGGLRELAERGRLYQEAVRARAEQLAKRIDDAGRTARDAQQAELDRRRGELARLQQDVEALAGSAGTAQRALSEGEERRHRATAALAGATAAVAIKRAQLDAVTSGSLLDELVQGLATTDAYRKELGTLARARTDFEQLSARMARARREFERGGTATPPVLDRIVLYIDDLDRCSKDKVQEVLRAVHLLLAFDLFVCVVAVDPRWVIQCLSDSPGVVRQSAVTDPDLDGLGGLATPSDYLEKIFQIPLWLRPVPAEQRAAVAATLLERSMTDRRAASHEGRPQEAASGVAANALGLPGPEAPALAAPDSIRIDPLELEFLDRVAPLLDGNVRALKRFANTYRLVKAALSDVELEVFAKTPYRLCMAQLAVLATQRSRARALVRATDAANGATTISAWLASLAASSDKVVAGLAVDLRQALLPELGDVEFARFALWLERTRRYSFYL